ncbi:MAG: alpha/beta hydrolase family protein [Acidimicrobiales bacterium]
MAPPQHGRRVNVRRRRFVAVLALILIVLLVVATTRGQGPTTSTTSSTTVTTATSSTTTTRATTPHAPFAVGAVTFTVSEPASGSTGARTFPVTVRYPAVGAPGTARLGLVPLRDAGPFPLLIFSQGFDISPEAYAGLLDAWSAAGYVVADPAYPYTSPNAAGGVIRSDIVHHPGDLSFLITTLIADSAQAGNALGGLVDAHEIGVVGQSDGGDVSLAAVANSCCRDARIGAAVILSGAELSWFPGTYFTTGSAPLLVVQGTNDLTMNPVTCSVTLYNEAPAPKYYLAMIGQTHLSAYVPPGPARDTVAAASIDFFNAYLRHAPGALAAMRTAGTRPGLATITSASKVPLVAGTCPDAPLG